MEGLRGGGQSTQKVPFLREIGVGPGRERLPRYADGLFGRSLDVIVSSYHNSTFLSFPFTLSLYLYSVPFPFIVLFIFSVLHISFLPSPYYIQVHVVYFSPVCPIAYLCTLSPPTQRLKIASLHRIGIFVCRMSMYKLTLDLISIPSFCSFTSPTFAGEHTYLKCSPPFVHQRKKKNKGRKPSDFQLHRFIPLGFFKTNPSSLCSLRGPRAPHSLSRRR